MKFIQVEISLPGSEKPFVLWAVFDSGEWRHMATAADMLDSWMTENLERNSGALDLLCSDGSHRRIGAQLLTQAIVQYQIIEMPAPDMPDAA